MARRISAFLLAVLGVLSLQLPSAAPARALTCASGGPCAIGDIGPGGGIVFLKPSSSGNSTGEFFEAAPNTWNGAAPDGTGEWCNATDAGIAGLGFTIGTGTTNSATIAGTCASTGTNDAAEYIRSLTIGGKSDWFLPSRDEMLALYDQRALLTGTFSTNKADVDVARYLTSSESTGFSTNAIAVYMEGSCCDGTAQDVSKQFAFSLRPVRMFTAAERSGAGAGTTVTNPPDVIQQVGRLPSEDCSGLMIPELDWSGATGNWGPSWAQWAVPVTGGYVCTRRLTYAGAGRWEVAP